MTPVIAIQPLTSLLLQAASSSVRALALALGAGLVLSVFRVKAASLRLFIWTVVLYVALAMPLLGWMLPPLSLRMPVSLQEKAAQLVPAGEPGFQPPTSTGNSSVANPSSASNEANQQTFAAPAASGSFSLSTRTLPERGPSIQWIALANAAYLAVTLVFLVRFVVGLVFARRLRQSSQRIHDPRVTLRLASRACASGLASVPHAAESALISVPVTTGALRSVILLPSGWREWGDSKLDAVLAHELSHVARRDALTQRLSLLHRAFFWFSPLAWWLDRHLADLAEQASDETALSCGADCRDYARTLLGFFEALHSTSGRVRWQGVAMAKAGKTEQRLERILAWKGAVTMSLKKPVAVAIIALAIPVVYLAASVRPADPGRSSGNVDSAQNQLPPAPDAAPVVPMVPVSPQNAAAPVLARAAQSVPSRSSPGHHFSYAYGDKDEQRFVIVSGKTDSFTMSGTPEDARHAEKLKKQIPGDFIWFQRDEKSYIIRDQATIDRARKLWAPQEELGRKQEELGKQQEALGKQQEELAAKAEKIQVKVPDMTAQLDKLRAELKQLGASATVEQIGRVQAEIGELQSKVGEIQSHAGEQQSRLGEEMGALGEKQGKLGEQQGELGRQQGELAEQASREMKQLLDEAISKGTAQPEPETGRSPTQ
jgi:beta-lactamase regulating signal transducer with metallopeptidase domain